jgi:lipoprotein-releasing system ATP-binding protein
MNESSPLRLDRVTRIFKQAGRELVVFRDVSLALMPGEIVALVGQSGAGKSSLLHIAGLLETPSSGEVYIGGEAASRLPERRRTEIRRKALGFVYQAHHLLPEFSAEENVGMPQRIAGGATARGIRRGTPSPGAGGPR